MADALTLGLSLFAAFAAIPNCSTAPAQTPQYNLVADYKSASSVRFPFEKIVNLEEINKESTIVKDLDYSYKMNEFRNKVALYKSLFVNYDDNEDLLLGMLYKDEEDLSFDEFIRYVFSQENIFLSESFLALLLESRINVLNPSFKEALLLCQNSRDKALSRKASSIINYYFGEN